MTPPLARGQQNAYIFGTGEIGNQRGPELISFDVGVLKNFRVTEKHQLEFRPEVFNIANTPNFALLSCTVDVSGGAAISSTVSDNQREIEFALKWLF